MSIRPRLAIVATYFGPPPLWMPAFLLSCRHNPDVQWLIFSDMTVTFPLPPNVAILPLSCDELNHRVSDTVGRRIEVRPARLKKLCDLKPTYGLVFERELRGYDFWAHSELDIVWGSIRSFMTDALLHAHDILAARHYRLAGHCTLFRNTPGVNGLFRQVPEMLDLMADDKHHRVDEHLYTAFLRGQIEGAVPPSDIRIYWPLELSLKADYQRALGDTPADRLWWRDGRTFDASEREVMYLHFHKLKKGMHEMAFGYDEAPKAFHVTRAGVSHV